MKKTLMLVAALAIGFTACKKEERVTREEVMRQGLYRISAFNCEIKRFYGADTTLNVLNDMPPCLRNVRFAFQMDRNAKQINQQKCDHSTPDEYMFRWELSPNDDTLILWDAASIVFMREILTSPLENFSSAGFRIHMSDVMVSEYDKRFLDSLFYTIDFSRD